MRTRILLCLLRVAVVGAFAPMNSLFRKSYSKLHVSDYDFALLFDCDGVILETEELHRLAYNQAFKDFGLTIEGKPVEWNVEYYDVLQNSIGGGKPKMFFHFRETMGGKFPMAANKKAPETPEEQQELIDSLQDHKTGIYQSFVEKKAIPRPGVVQLMDEALEDPNVAVGVCSASTKEAALKVLSVTLGKERQKKLDVCILGDDVSEKKPSPMIYNEARKRIGIESDRCVVIEDSMVGLRAAKAAGMKCVVTYTASTENEDFYAMGADAKVPDLESRKVGLDSILSSLRGDGGSEEILVGKRDPKPSESA